MESCFPLVYIYTCKNIRRTGAHTCRYIRNSESEHTFFFFLHLCVQHFAHNLGSVEVTATSLWNAASFWMQGVLLMLEDSVTGLHAACSACRLQVNVERTAVPRATMNLSLTSDHRCALQKRNTAESLPNAQNAACFHRFASKGNRVWTSFFFSH